MTQVCLQQNKKKSEAESKNCHAKTMLMSAHFFFLREFALSQEGKWGGVRRGGGVSLSGTVEAFGEAHEPCSCLNDQCMKME
jgi:hypothetical protein